METTCEKVRVKERDLFCGPPWASLRQILGIGLAKGVASWLPDARIYYVHLGRVAVRYACRLIGISEGDEILVPAYNCGSEIDPLLCSGASLNLYRVDHNARIDLNDLDGRISNKTRVVYVTHYFGMPHPLAEIKALCRDRKILLIEDCALSLFSCDGQIRLGTQGDIAIFSFRKTLPVPEGGAVVINNPDLPAEDWARQKPPISKLSRGMLSLAKRYVLNASSQSGVLYSKLWSLLDKTPAENDGEEEYNSFFPDMAPNVYYNPGLDNQDICGITRRMLRTFDGSQIRSRRRENFRRYLDMLSSLEGVEPLYKELPEGACPLHFPVLVHRRDAVCRKLNALSIDAMAWWSGYHRSLPWPEYPDACFLKDRLLTLPVHQGLNSNHIEFICRKLSHIMRNLPASAA